MSFEDAPRLCHVVKVDTFDGYGFNLHAEKGKPGQFIGKVDKGSPAETAGLKEGDMILEVNGESIAKDNHKNVVQKIKGMPNETKLLVVTPKEKTSGMSVYENEKRTSNGSDKKLKQQENAKIEDEKKMNGVEEKTNGNMDKHAMFAPKGPEISKLNLGMTAAEMRAQLAARKKTDPKKVPMDFKSKFDIVKQL